MHDALEEYYEVLEGQQKATGTLQQYCGGLKVFSEWLETEGLDPTAVTTRDLQRWLGWLKSERGYAPKTIRGYFSPVSGFFSDLESTGVIDEDPTDDIVVKDYASEETRKQQVTKQRRIWMTKAQVRQLIEHVPKPVIRNRTMTLMQYFTGLRRQEVVDIRLEDIDREARAVQVRGKNNEIHTARWQPQLDGLINTWIDGGYRASSPYAAESPSLFLSESSPSLNGDTLNDVVVQAATNAGFQEVLYEDAKGRNRYKYTSHVLRHSFSMHWLENGGSIEGLSKYLAHSSVTTTEIYAEILEERANEEYEQYAPEIDIDI